MEKLEKQSEVGVMKGIRRKEKLQKLLSSWECITETVTAVSVAGTLAIMVFYDKVPSVYEATKEYVKYLFR